jgi:hypothetical protein
MKDNRGLVNRKAFSNSIDRELFHSLELLHQKTRLPKSKLLDEAIELLVDKYSEREVI